MTVQKLASFTRDGKGGNPAGVMLATVLPEAEEMQEIAADLGFSETAFGAPEGDGYRVRYFAPKGEVPFCGHATIAIGAAIGQMRGPGRYPLTLNDAEIAVEAYQDRGAWGARLISPPTHHVLAEPALRTEGLDVFGLTEADLDPEIAVARIHGGADHLLLPLKERRALFEMRYEFEAGAAFMQKYRFVTVNLIWRESETLIHSRNAFAGHGVYEDPATGAAAAALAGYLRDAGLQWRPFRVAQGDDMGAPSDLWVTPKAEQGGPVEIAGTVRSLAA